MRKWFQRGERPVPKYYLYISATKLDNLLPQIPRAFVESFEAEFKVSVGLLSAAVRSTPTDSAAELSARVGLLSTYLDEVERIGSVMLPERYVRGTASLRYGVVGEYASELAFFGGVVDDVKVGLIGSPASMVGEVSRSEANHAPYYYTLTFLNRIAGSDSEVVDEPPYYSHSAAIDIALDALPATPYRVEFLARTLYSKSDVLVATPIYVALVD